MKNLWHHFGKHCFEPECKVQMLCDGHTNVKSNSIEYAYEVGGIKETIDYSVKNMADEKAAQLARQVNSKGVLPDTIDRVDVVHGGDHGCGAFIAGSRVSVILLDTGDKSNDSFSFEISVPEIQCRKDNAEILSLTIKDDLTKGFRTIAEAKLNVYLDEKNKVVCSFGNGNLNTAIKSVSPHIYAVGDLAYYGMILGKEGMSGDHYHLCKLAAKRFVQLAKDEDPWVQEEFKMKGER